MEDFVGRIVKVYTESTESTESEVKYSIVHFSEYTRVVDLSVLCLKHRKYCSDSTVPSYFFSRPYKEKEKKAPFTRT